jgi:hypothetical protein
VESGIFRWPDSVGLFVMIGTWDSDSYADSCGNHLVRTLTVLSRVGKKSLKNLFELLVLFCLLFLNRSGCLCCLVC